MSYVELKSREFWFKDCVGRKGNDKRDVELSLHMLKEQKLFKGQIPCKEKKMLDWSTEGFCIIWCVGRLTSTNPHSYTNLQWSWVK